MIDCSSEVRVKVIHDIIIIGDFTVVTWRIKEQQQ